jgi:hypothetical protein
MRTPISLTRSGPRKSCTTWQPTRTTTSRVAAGWTRTS